MKTEIENRTPSVETLSQLSFFVPSYQRGYRWTPDEVRDLLDDILQFSVQKAGDPEEFYCLQPLVVRRMDSGQWEVIDGQQRLTTIYLISRYINEMWRGRDKYSVLKLQYDSRKRTKEFLDSLAVKDNGTVTFNDDNIDFAHISKAYQTIDAWWNKPGSGLDKDRFASAFRRQVRVIWYEPPGSESVQIFTRINRGKIPLTNAELIRGLFLKSSNFEKPDASPKQAKPEQAKLAQLWKMEISGEWDRMEAALHDDKFWCFLTDREDPAETRIDLIFRLVTGEDDDDNYALFHAYAKNFPKEANVDSVLREWDKVKSCFQQLQDWYLDWELYHLIGYLIAAGTSLSDLWSESTNVRKSEFLAELRSRIKASIPEDLEKLEYGQGAVKNVLLLHNILTTLDSRERHFRFPFSRLKEQKWDVEHIHSVAEKPPESELHQREWLSDSAKHLLDINLKEEVAKFLEKSSWVESEFEAVYLIVLKSFSEKGELENINELSNLALLDSGTNRGYGNAVFPAKREKIIKKEREGTFVPIATKNAFMKYYSNPVQGFTFWSEADRQAYFEAIQTTLGSFFAGKKGHTP